MAAAGLAQVDEAPWLELANRRDGLHGIRIRLCCQDDQLQKHFTALLSPVWGVLTHLFAERPEWPRACQVATCPPDGQVGDDCLGKEDTPTGNRYHIDGQGKIPNDFGLLMGVALTPRPPGSKSWGCLVVHPGTHTNSLLLQTYRPKSESNMNLDPGVPVRLDRGDVVLAHPLLAHYRERNYSEDTRHQVYFRLRPESAATNPLWNKDLPHQPFAVLRGLERRPCAKELPEANVPAKRRRTSQG